MAGSNRKKFFGENPQVVEEDLDHDTPEGKWWKKKHCNTENVVRSQVIGGESCAMEVLYEGLIFQVGTTKR
jgi:hypothetical protein